MRVRMVGAGLASLVNVKVLGPLGRLFAFRMLQRLRAHRVAPAVFAAWPPPTPATSACAAVDFLFGLAVGALFVSDQRLPVGDGNLIVVGMDLRERQKAVAVAAVIDEGGLERRLYPRNLGEIDIAAQLAAVRGLKVEFLE